MKSEQPEALRLADLMEPCCLTIGDAQQAVAASELRRLHAENEALRAQIGQGVPDGWQLVRTDALKMAIDFAVPAMKRDRDSPSNSAWMVEAADRNINAVRAMLASAPPAPQALTTCNCRWDGDTQVQQCTLHQAHIDAIHEWAERAKTAEAELAAQQQKPLLFSEIWDNDAIMEVNADARLPFEMIERFVRAVEAAHNIGEKK